MRERPTLASFTADAPFLQAILDVLGDLYDLLDERLPAVEQSGEVRKVTEPAPATPPAETAPISEPAPEAVPDVPGEDEDEEGGPVVVTEPALPAPPPRRGRGSGLDAWQAYAAAAGVAHPDGATRDDIIGACEQAGVITSD